MAEGPSPLVSILLPVFEPHPRYFPQAMRSLLEQTFTDFELLVVEDPSSRRGRDLLDAIGDHRLRWLEGERRTSLVAQLNRGVAAARGEWIARADADDVSEPDRIAAQLELMQARPEIDVLGAQLTLIDERDQPIGTRSYPIEHDDVARAMRRYNAMPHPAVLVRRALLASSGGYRHEGRAATDYELWSRLAGDGARLGNHPRALLRYRVHAGAMKSSHTRDSLRMTREVKRAYWRRQFDLGDRFRYHAEGLLMLVPPRWVWWLFARVVLRARGTASPPSR